MSRKTLLILALGIIFLVILGTFLYPYINKPKEDTAKRKCIEDNTKQCLALLGGESNSCASNDHSCNYRYYIGNAIRTEKTEWCNSLEGIEQDFCKALIIKNISFCNLFDETKEMEKEQKDACIGLMTQNENLCDNLNDPITKGGCLVALTGNTTYCKYFTEKC